MTDITLGDNWGKVSRALEAEVIKIKSYDRVIKSLIGEVFGKKVLDFGSGPGILAESLQNQGALSFVYDIDPYMRKTAGLKVGESNVYSKSSDIPLNHYDFAICNLVLCIVEEEEVQKVLRLINGVIKHNGRALIGFCNPALFNVPETQLDIRFPSGNSYCELHSYKKLKKEGNYEITERHRPIEWYCLEFLKAGFKLERKVYTDEYGSGGNNIQDFVIFELSKE